MHLPSAITVLEGEWERKRKAEKQNQKTEKKIENKERRKKDENRLFWQKRLLKFTNLGTGFHTYLIRESDNNLV